MPSRFHPLVRLLARYVGTHRRVAAALERIADVAEGRAPRVATFPEAPTERLVLRTPDDYAAAYSVEERLRDQLRRDPTEEEILRELDAIPWREELPDGGVPQ